ncbi:glycoside hydrolase family 3 N-terminal domain-containing protein [Picosynechococcus sp. PCC 7117]|uniref:glycoside hydrolase family 3 N-terminal domain-containing protein n=1 Tax=Picosynechococcus sp. PCC 7117 TaxID=195498 RepID=UPI000810857F|nr:beta-glucosidase [Picosynechococcus sp. PCC 7117]
MAPLPPVESLSLRQAIAQMIVVRGAGYLFDHERPYPQWEADQTTLQRWIEAGIGGVILLGGSAAEVAQKTKQLQSWAEIPLLIAADIEEGVGQRFRGATEFPPPMAFGEIWRTDPHQAIALAETMGATTAQEALSLGINWVLAPVLDVNNNPHNPVINIRAFGETPDQVSALGTAFIRGAQQYAVLTTAKHFPGHGDTATDSHLALPTISHGDTRLNTVELPPFKAAIQGGVDAVMSAHLMIPAWDQQYPATLSPAILTGQLRHKLGFAGLIVTDALVMGGITQFAAPDTVVVQAIAAGADILLMPPDVDGAIIAIETAIKTGQLSESRIYESVERIWQAKQKILTATPSTFPQGISGDRPETRKTVAMVLERATKHQKSPVKISSFPDNFARNLIVVDSVLKSPFLRPNCPVIAIPQRHGYAAEIVELKTLPRLQLEAIPTLIQCFLRGNPFTEKLADPIDVLQKIAAQIPLQGVIFYGSPYFLEALQTTLPEIPWWFSYGQMAIAQAEICTSLWEEAPQADPSAAEFI